MRFLRFALTVISLICAVPHQSDASPLKIFRNIMQKSKSIDQVSPSASPVNSRNTSTPVTSPKEETCDLVSYKCGIKEYNISACVPFMGNVSEQGYVLVMNDGESTRVLNMTVLPANYTVENVNILGHESNKVKLPSNMGSGYSSIVLNSENGNCTIYIGASIFDTYYTNYLTPINGTYVLFVAALFIGGALICCMLRKKGRHLDGGKYQELEMEQQEPNGSSTIETSKDWDQEWDDDWDVEKR